MEDNYLNTAYWFLEEILQANVTHVDYKGQKAEIVGYHGTKLLLKVDGKNVSTCPKNVKINCKYERNNNGGD